MSDFRPTLPPPGVDVHFMVGDQSIPVSYFEVVSGSYGSVGHAAAHTSRALVEAAGIDLVAIAGSAPLVPVAVFAETPTVPHTKIFDGDLLSTEWDMDADQIVVHARDHAGVFVDQKRILARDAGAITAALNPLSPGQQLSPTGVSTVNRKISQVVTDIAQQFGYTPVLNMGSGTDVLTGALYGSSDHTYMTIPQNLWSILNTLARDSGNEVYTTPDRKLVFGEPGAGLKRLQFTWNVQTGTLQTDSMPCARLQVTHNPRRNGSFRVLVFSYDPARATSTVGRATVVAQDLSTPSLPIGTSTGAAATQADKQLLDNAKTTSGGSASDLSHVQLYTFHWDGLTNDDANARAAAIAADIQKRLLLLRCTIDGLPTLSPTQPFQVQGKFPQQFAGNTWYVNGYTHRFVMPSPRSHQGWSGFTTDIHALDLPSVALAGTVR